MKTILKNFFGNQGFFVLGTGSGSLPKARLLRFLPTLTILFSIPKALEEANSLLAHFSSHLCNETPAVQITEGSDDKAILTV